MAAVAVAEATLAAATMMVGAARKAEIVAARVPAPILRAVAEVVAWPVAAAP